MDIRARSKVSGKGGIIIPDLVRQGFSITAGDALEWLEVLIGSDNTLMFKLRLVKGSFSEENQLDREQDEHLHEERIVNPFLQMQNALEEISEKQDIIISRLQSTSISKEDITKRIQEIIEKEGCITWTRTMEDDILCKCFKCREEYARIVMQLAGMFNWKTELIGNKRIFYKEGFDVDKLKRQARWRQLKWNDREVMEITERHCRETQEERIDIDAFLRENFPQFTEREYDEARWKFMRLCNENPQWALVPVKVGYCYSDYVEKKKGEETK